MMGYQGNVTDEQLSFILDDIADPDLLEEVHGSPEAAARLAAWQQWEAQIAAPLHRWDCPPAQQLADYHWGFVDRSAAQIIARHLETCVRCTEEIATLRMFLDAEIDRKSVV